MLSIFVFLKALKEAPLGAHGPAFLGSRPSAVGQPLVAAVYPRLCGTFAHGLVAFGCPRPSSLAAV